MLKAVIFDMDGVLIDSEYVHYVANKETMKKWFDIDVTYEYYKQFIGGTVEKMWQIIIKDFGLINETPEHLNKLTDEVLCDLIKESGYPEVPGVACFVKQLKEKGLKLAVASSASMSRIELNLEKICLKEYFDVKVSGQDIGRSKPDPTVFLKACEGLGYEPSECIVIEDSMNGVLAAKNGNIPCLGFINKNSGDQDLSKADALFESFENLDMQYVNMIYSHAVSEPATITETKRLRIREITVDDVKRMYELYDEKITRFMPTLFEKIEDEIDYTRKYIDSVYKFYHYGMWVVELKDNGEVIGRVGVEYKQDSELEAIETQYSHELGYMIGSKYQGNGYGYEAASAVLDYVKEQYEIDDIFVEVSPENIASINLATKLGFMFVDTNVNKRGYIIGKMC